VPAWAFAVPLTFAALSAAAWGRTAAGLRRRRRRAESALAQGLSADTVLAEAGFAGSAGWLPLDTGALPSALLGLSSAALGEVQSWARRRDDASVVSFTNGATVAFSGATKSNCHYVLALIRPPRRNERELAEWVAAALAAAAGQPPADRSRVDDSRAPNEHRVVALVALECFDRVRRGAGQLVAERVVAEVERELRSTLRQNDALIRLDDDTFGISALVTGLDGLETLESRIARAVEAVKLPARLEPLTPRVVADTSDRADAIPELAAIEAKLLPGARAPERVQ
jgi:GGDEF domain-containing protein